MALVLFAVLFLFGATGMERRRGILFSTITGLLLFAWALPLVIQDASPSGMLHIFIEAAAALIAFLGLAALSYFVGRWVRALANRVRGSRSQ